MDIMEEPVVNESGNSYEKQILKEAYKNTEKIIDPITALPIRNVNFLITNKNLKALIKRFLNDQPWAFKFNDNPKVYWQEIKC